ncbi:MAG: nucleotide sugar dehydrogenase [Bacteroidota bacterium]
MYRELLSKEKKIAVIGLGYVGLPIALAFARKTSVVGFDINAERIKMMQDGIDPSKELSSDKFLDTDIQFTYNYEDLKAASFFIVAVPTPIDNHKTPNLHPILSASKTIGEVISKGDYVVFESTVYPGCTEEDCVPLIEELSGLKGVVDFKIGYSPERINPGDQVHTLENIIKIVAGCDEESTEEIAKVYEIVVEAGTYRASSIKVAEAAKVIENTQRDLNISFMNELSIIFDKMNINTHEVIKAAGTKWNFQKFYPGLVGGHCIGVDPYYLTYKSKQLGYDPQVILSGRRINDGMAAYVAKKTVQSIIKQGKDPQVSKILVMGITFKENVSDIRNSKVADLVKELRDYSIQVDVTDPNADREEVLEEYGFGLVSESNLEKVKYDAIILAVNHDEYKQLDIETLKGMMNNNPVLVDLKNIFPISANGNLIHWTL